uniref:Uncharacterized protein n=1 Tax=Engystomops pustulosus TaxID=76066 RepID=A0AAV6Z1J3_ENGPU|nr:hypothetical protein GDO81_025558 [Engystomops pustulosus]
MSVYCAVGGGMRKQSVQLRSCRLLELHSNEQGRWQPCNPGFSERIPLSGEVFCTLSAVHRKHKHLMGLILLSRCCAEDCAVPRRCRHLQKGK